VGTRNIKDRQLALAIAQWREAGRNSPAQAAVSAFVDQLEAR